MAVPGLRVPNNGKCSKLGPRVSRGAPTKVPDSFRDRYKGRPHMKTLPSSHNLAGFCRVTGSPFRCDPMCACK